MEGKTQLGTYGLKVRFRRIMKPALNLFICICCLKSSGLGTVIQFDILILESGCLLWVSSSSSIGSVSNFITSEQFFDLPTMPFHNRNYNNFINCITNLKLENALPLPPPLWTVLDILTEIGSVISMGGRQMQRNLQKITDVLYVKLFQSPIRHKYN